MRFAALAAAFVFVGLTRTHGFGGGGDDKATTLGSMTWTYAAELHVPSQPNNKVIPYAHGLEVDSKDRLYLTYWDWNTTRRACLVRWDPSSFGQSPEIVGNGTELAMCKGGTGSYATDSVHGIRLVKEPCQDSEGQCE